MPMQIYATECAAQVSTLACSILRRTPVVRPAVIELADLGQRSLSKIYLGGPPLPPTQRVLVPFFDLFLIFFRSCWSKPSSSSHLCPRWPKLDPRCPLLGSKLGVRGDLGAKLGSKIDQKSIKNRIISWILFLIVF